MSRMICFIYSPHCEWNITAILNINARTQFWKTPVFIHRFHLCNFKMTEKTRVKMTQLTTEYLKSLVTQGIPTFLNASLGVKTLAAEGMGTAIFWLVPLLQPGGANSHCRALKTEGGHSPAVKANRCEPVDEKRTSCRKDEEPVIVLSCGSPRRSDCRLVMKAVFSIVGDSK